MTRATEGEYRNEDPGGRTPRPALQVVRGEATAGPRPPGPAWLRRHEARRRVDRETHALVVETPTEAVPAQFADWWYDLRRGQLRIYGGLLRFLDIRRDAGTPKAVLLLIPRILEAYIEDLYDDGRRPTRPSGETPRKRIA